jgi:transcriptional regulator with XRE-family HTH domain
VTRQELIARRMNMGLSHEKAARLMNVNRKTLVRFERGERVELESLRKIAAFYDVLVTDIVPVEDVAS